ncbi:DUF411 domain-containing protein [Paracoccus sp. Z118]|uniref:DUF411 domain-containing protein n=1 Tax=Paracoccus sp. Z118 TaxID=2851017 RepID=UPI001C2C0174|nr:DUF411 domain-containing protein [Paracoccus sp. Z118]MBV0891564.1 DUF411 domain-containing protein [Paracoccus sp. Z118]
MQNIPTISRRAMLVGGGALALLLPLAARTQAESLPLVSVAKDRFCGCCDGWVEHVRAAGFPVRVEVSDDMDRVKQRLGVPPALASCHTAEVDGYVVEGHVPVTALQRLLSERPAATGLAAPGMPAGSPGMDYPGVTPERYDIVLFGPSGPTTFATFLGGQEV